MGNLGEIGPNFSMGQTNQATFGSSVPKLRYSRYLGIGYDGYSIILRKTCGVYSISSTTHTHRANGEASVSTTSSLRCFHLQSLSLPPTRTCDKYITVTVPLIFIHDISSKKHQISCHSDTSRQDKQDKMTHAP